MLVHKSPVLHCSNGIGSIYHGIMVFGRVTGQLLLWAFNGQCKVDRFGVESMLESVLNNIYDRKIY